MWGYTCRDVLLITYPAPACILLLHMLCFAHMHLCPPAPVLTHLVITDLCMQLACLPSVLLSCYGLILPHVLGQLLS